MELRICRLYPDLMDLYGDSGNIKCLRCRCLWRGIDVSVAGISLGDSFDPDGYDLIYMGGGQEFERAVVLSDLAATGKDAAIRSAVENGSVFLAVGGGFQLLGKGFTSASGEKWDYIGALDLYTADGGSRMTGDFMFERGGISVVGFEDHSGRIHLGNGLEPLGKVLAGHGNNGADGTEGAKYKNVFGTTSHGPVLPKNPAYCDEIIAAALSRRYGEVSLEPLDDTAENLAREQMVKRLSGQQ